MTPQILYLPPPSMETFLLSWSWPSVRLPSTGLVAPSYLQFWPSVRDPITVPSPYLSSWVMSQFLFKARKVCYLTHFVSLLSLCNCFHSVPNQRHLSGIFRHKNPCLPRIIITCIMIIIIILRKMNFFGGILGSPCLSIHPCVRLCTKYLFLWKGWQGY